LEIEMKTKPWPHSPGIIALNEYYGRETGVLLGKTFQATYNGVAEEFSTYELAAQWIDLQKQRETVTPLFDHTELALAGR
jgi:hypothetical protein